MRVAAGVLHDSISRKPRRDQRSPASAVLRWDRRASSPYNKGMPHAGMIIRRAEPNELAWINARYSEVDFVPSSAADTIAIAEVDGTRAGIGRIVKLTADAAELGGMLVFETYRGRGIAASLVAHLLARSADYRHLYCLPFAHLAPFYERYGFRASAPDGVGVPPAARDKHTWCNQHYEHETLFLVRP